MTIQVINLCFYHKCKEKSIWPRGHHLAFHEVESVKTNALIISLIHLLLCWVAWTINSLLHCACDSTLASIELRTNRTVF
jgi:hypothetical protein